MSAIALGVARAERRVPPLGDLDVLLTGHALLPSVAGRWSPRAYTGDAAHGRKNGTQ